MYGDFAKKYNVRKFTLPILIIIIAAVSTTVILAKRKTITVVTKDKSIKFVTYKSNVRQALEKEKIPLDPKDKVYPSLDTKLSNNERITIKRAVNINISVDGKKLKLKSAEDNVSKMFKAEGIAMAEVDKVKPAMANSLAEGMNITITRVTSKAFKKTIHLGHKVITKFNSAMANTKRYTAVEGRDGEKTVTTLVTYHDGKVASSKIVKDVYLTKPRDTVIVQGTYPLMPVGLDGKVLPYRSVFKVRATAYWAVRGVGRTFTGSGRRAVRNSRGYSTIAVDRHLIPYGTKLFIEGYGFAVAADTGTAIIGRTIDVFFNTKSEACQWAVKHPNLYILR